MNRQKYSSGGFRRARARSIVAAPCFVAHGVCMGIGIVRPLRLCCVISFVDNVPHYYHELALSWHTL